jgi:mannose-6-phosphate isomerase-like protein (cupin superfamily)
MAAMIQLLLRRIATVAIMVTIGAGATHGSGSKVTFIDHESVSAAFERGAPLIETDTYKVHASRREGPGQAEVHERDTDIIYVLQGSVTFVTGGTVMGGSRIGPAEVRGTGIEGGESRRLVEGDVVIVPSGVPHWFEEVDAPFLYYVVKVTNPEMKP